MLIQWGVKLDSQKWYDMDKKNEYLQLKRKLYSVIGELGGMAEMLDAQELNTSYEKASELLDNFDNYGDQHGYNEGEL